MMVARCIGAWILVTTNGAELMPIPCSWRPIITYKEAQRIYIDIKMSCQGPICSAKSSVVMQHCVKGL